jgi:hypothetical protein
MFLVIVGFTAGAVFALRRSSGRPGLLRNSLSWK